MNEAQRNEHRLYKLVMQAICWWFGCDPDHDKCATWRDEHDFGVTIPCKRCGALDVKYADLVGNTRHNRVKSWLYWWLFRRWFPKKCHDCGKRFGDHCDCDNIPF